MDRVAVPACPSVPRRLAAPTAEAEAGSRTWALPPPQQQQQGLQGLRAPGQVWVLVSQSLIARDDAMPYHTSRC